MLRRIAAVALFLLAVCSDATAFQFPAKVDFVRDVQPILREHCVECHGPAQQMRGLRLDRRRDAIPNRVGANRARIIPGSSDRSLLYSRVSGSGSGVQMPPAGPLRADQIRILKDWIDQGAEWPDSVAGDRSTTPPDPTAVGIGNALRTGNRPAFVRALREHPESVNGKGPSGWTPLMYAALYGDVESIRALLSNGANPNLQNDDGGTALMYAADDRDKTKLLLDGGANPNLRSGEGRTALLIAVGIVGNHGTVQLLLDRGADLKVRTSEGRDVLSLAVGPGSAPVLKLLLERGAATKQPPLGSAIANGCPECFELLLTSAQPEDLNSALSTAVANGNVPLIRKLLDSGARSSGTTLAFAAASPATLSEDLVKLLIGRGADVNGKTRAGTSVMAFSRLQGKPNFVKTLLEAGAVDDITPAAAVHPKPAKSVGEAIRRSIPALQRADVAFLDRAGCVSCHNNSLVAMTISAARRKRVPLNEATAKSQLRRIAAFMEENRERALEQTGLAGGVDTVSYILLGLAEEKYPSDAITDAWAVYLKRRQSPDGSWLCLTTIRPPLETSDFQVTAASLRALRAYGAPSQRAQYDLAVRRATEWLEKAQPRTTEDHAYKVLGLIWGGGRPASIRTAARELLALQRAEGGWGQIGALAPDAYATGQALVALHESRVVSAKNPAFQRGVRYLMNSQQEDGSWYVQTRAFPLQPHFESDFPHGRDQFISAAATAWATMALTAGLR